MRCPRRRKDEGRLVLVDSRFTMLMPNMDWLVVDPCNICLGRWGKLVIVTVRYTLKLSQQAVRASVLQGLSSLFVFLDHTMDSEWSSSCDDVYDDDEPCIDSIGSR